MRLPSFVSSRSLPLAAGTLLLAATSLVSAPSIDAAGAPKASPSTAATAATAAATSKAATSASLPPNTVPPAHAMMANRHLPGRVIVGEILSYDAASKALRVRNLRNEEIDLVIGEKTRVDADLKIGEMVRTRFEEVEGKNVPLFITSRGVRQPTPPRAGSAVNATAAPKVDPVGAPKGSPEKAK